MDIVSIHTSPERLVKCADNNHLRLAELVSIHTSPERLVKSCQFSEGGFKGGGFNPYQPRKAGEILDFGDEKAVTASFNPYQPRKAGEIVTSGNPLERDIEFQSIPAPKGW